MKLAVTFIGLLLSSAALADAELRFDDDSQVLIKDGRVLFGDADASIIYPGSGTSMTVVEHENRSYMIIDKDFANNVSAQMEAAMSAVESQLASLPADQQARMRAMLKERMPGAKAETSTYEFRASGKDQKISGFSCRGGDLLKDGEKEGELCVSKPGELGMSKEDFKALGAAFGAMQSLVGQFAPGAGQILDIDVIGGVPIMSNSFDSDKQSRLVSANFGKVDAERLSVPKDYQQKDLPDM